MGRILSILGLMFAWLFEPRHYFLGALAAGLGHRETWGPGLLSRERISRRTLYIALYSLAGAIFAYDGCTVNISGTTLFDNNSASTYNGGETVRACVWGVCEKRERACVRQLSMMVKGSSETVHHA